MPHCGHVKGRMKKEDTNKEDVDMRLLALVGISGLLAACAVGPDYARPEIPAGDAFRMAREAADLPSLANMPWWELYQDKELQKLIRIALEENKDLERVLATIDEFEARLFIARTDFIPQMTATSNFPVGRLGGGWSPSDPSREQPVAEALKVGNN